MSPGYLFQKILTFLTVYGRMSFNRILLISSSYGSHFSLVEQKKRVKNGVKLHEKGGLNLQASHSQRSIHLPLTWCEWLPYLHLLFQTLILKSDLDAMAGAAFRVSKAEF